MGGSGGTQVQRACGYEDATEDMFAYLMAAQGEFGDEAKIRLYCDESVAHFDWLVSMGAKYRDSEYKERAIMALTADCLLYTGNEKSWPFSEIAKPTAFCRAEAVEEWRRQVFGHRTTPLSCGNVPGPNRRDSPKWSGKERKGVGTLFKLLSPKLPKPPTPKQKNG